MQQIYLPKAVCRGIRADVHRPKEALERHRRIRLHERLRAEGCSEALALEAAGTPRSTLFRWRAKAKRRRRFDGHARRWRPGMKAKAPGELVQVDHMTLNFPGTRIKEFRALRPFTKMMVARPCARATARNAKRFLAEMLGDLPFPVRSVQVDGGSEFRRDFEEACREAGVPLFVLPPKSPKRNGCVEKANDSSRTEFRGLCAGGPTLDEVRPQLAERQHFHNHVRPHQSLNMQTPMEYLQSLPKEGQTQSHLY